MEPLSRFVQLRKQKIKAVNIYMYVFLTYLAMEDENKATGMKRLNAKYLPSVGNQGNEMHHQLLEAFMLAVTSRGTRISEIWSRHRRPISTLLRRTENAKAKALRLQMN